MVVIAATGACQLAATATNTTRRHCTTARHSHTAHMLLEITTGCGTKPISFSVPLFAKLQEPRGQPLACVGGRRGVALRGVWHPLALWDHTL